jgi:hypothetical protein
MPAEHRFAGAGIERAIFAGSSQKHLEIAIYGILRPNIAF